MKKAILLVPLALAVNAGIYAQSIAPSTLNATGGTAIISGSVFDWSVGEMTMVSTLTNSNVIVTQGLLQPADATTGVAQVLPAANHLSIFPNPASYEVNVVYSAPGQGTIASRLIDMTGKTVSNLTTDITPGTTTQKINVSAIACATYILEVTVTNGTALPQTSSYQIQKLK